MDSTIIGVSKNIQRIRALIDQVADTGLNTVINGETGVGKELVVQNLYQKSNRTGKPFVKVNCAALPDTLLESEMFGYEPGAFTGAERRKRCSQSFCTCCKAAISVRWALKNQLKWAPGSLPQPITIWKRIWSTVNSEKTCTTG